MEAASRAVDAALVERGWAADDRPFRPHLTLARSDGVPAGAAIAGRLMARAAELRVRFQVERIGLFESLTGGGPARYEPLDDRGARRLMARARHADCADRLRRAHRAR